MSFNASGYIETPQLQEERIGRAIKREHQISTNRSRTLLMICFAMWLLTMGLFFFVLHISLAT